MFDVIELNTIRRLAVFAVALTCGFQARQAVAAEPFAMFAGRWTGGGEIVTTSGAQEKISCKVKYSTGGGKGTLHTNVKCASDSYRVHILIDVTADGSHFAGTWAETTRQAQGDVDGQVPAPGELQASLGGLGFGIQLAATSNGKQQAVTIQSQNTDVQSVKITLRKI